jgi:peptide/nickel transport system substrate-binding protein
VRGVHAHSRSLVAAIACITVVAVTAACSPSGGTSGSSGNDAAAPVRGGTLTIGRPADFQDFSGNDVESNYVWHQIAEPLFRTKPDGSGTVPWLAKSYTVSTDGLTYTIKLHDGVTFSNGAPMTSKDVKFTLLNTKANADWGFANQAIKSIQTPDRLTVIITTKYPWAPMLADLALFANAIIPADFGGRSSKAFYKAPIGTGPFEWDGWTKGVDQTLVRNPNYWVKGQPYLDKVVYKTIPEDTTRALQLQSGDLDLVEAPPPAQVKTLEANSNLSVLTVPSLQLDYLSMNQARAPYNDVNFRRAVDYGIDRDSIVKAALFDQGTKANSMLMANIAFYDSTTPGGQYDVQKAKASLAKANVPADFQMPLLYDPSNLYQKTTAELIQSDLGKVGIKVKLVGTEQNAIYGLWFDKNFDTVLLRWANDIADPDEWLQFALNPAQGTFNAFTSYKNPQVTSDVVQAARTLNNDKRAQLYSQVQHTTAGDVNMALLDYPDWVYATSDKVKGFVGYATAEYHLGSVWIAK